MSLEYIADVWYCLARFSSRFPALKESEMVNETDGHPQGGPPPTRSEQTSQASKPVSGATIAMMILAATVVIGTLIFSFSGQKKIVSGAAGTYGECKVEDTRRTQFMFTCPNQVAFMAALVEFSKKNPGKQTASISVWFK